MTGNEGEPKSKGARILENQNEMKNVLVGMSETMRSLGEEREEIPDNLRDEYYEEERRMTPQRPFSHPAPYPVPKILRR